MLKNDETVEVKYRVKDTPHHRIGARMKPSVSVPLPAAMKGKTNPGSTGSQKSVRKVQVPVNSDVAYVLPTKIKQV